MILAIRQKIGDAIEEIETIRASARGRGDLLTDAEKKRVRRLQSEIRDFEEQLEIEERNGEISNKYDKNRSTRPPTRPEPDEGYREEKRSMERMISYRASEGPWKNETFGRFLQAVARAGISGNADLDPRLEARVSGLHEGIGSEGGFLLQSGFSGELLKFAEQTGQIVSLVPRIPMKAGTNTIELPMIDESSRAHGSRWGGIRVYRLEEGGDKDSKKSKPKIRQLSMKLKKMVGLCYASDEILEDSTLLEQIIKEGFGAEIGFQLDDEILNGDGASQFLGITSSAAKVAVSKETGQPADTVQYENITKMWSRLPGWCRKSAVWLINQDVEPQLFGMGLILGTGASPVYLPPAGASGSPYGTLFGRPVMIAEQCASLGDEGDIVLFDPKQYVITDRNLQSAQSIHVKFVTDESTFRFVYRNDGMPTWVNPLTPFKGADDLSPYVTLETRS
jgi:HK97 family phage major capsid protein